MKKKIYLVVLSILIIGAFLITSRFLRPAGKKLIPEFPTVPVYPKAKLFTSSKIEDETVEEVGIRYQGIWQSNDSVPLISEWYQKNLTQSGWTIDVPPADINQNIQLIVFKKDEKTINLSLVTIDKSKSEITLDYFPRRVIEIEKEEG